MGDRLLEIAKACVAAAVAAVVAILADVEWGGVIGAALAGGGTTWVTPNKRRLRRN